MNGERAPRTLARGAERVDIRALPDNPYLLLTPGPLSTTKTVKAAMLRDWCTWDDDYNGITQGIRAALARLATPATGYTAVLMQGSGTFCVEATIGTAVHPDGALLVLVNGAYGARMVDIARRLRIHVMSQDSGEARPIDLALLDRTLGSDPGITHVAVVHGETTSGMLNPVGAIGQIVQSHKRRFMVDAMSTFGGVPLDMAGMGADFLISSANKCIQGVPGFGFVVARREELERTKGQARSLSLDLYDQWREMETKGGKWRFTSPTHVVRAFAQALKELEEEGGVEARHRRYQENHRILVEEMGWLNFSCLLPKEHRSPVITTFLGPAHPGYCFPAFHAALKKRGFVIYPGKVTALDTFRIGTIGDVHPADIRRLVAAVKASMFWREREALADPAVRPVA